MLNVNAAPLDTANETTDLLVVAIHAYEEFEVEAVSDAGKAFFAKHLGEGAVGCRVPAAGFAEMVGAAIEQGLVTRVRR